MNELDEKDQAASADTTLEAVGTPPPAPDDPVASNDAEGFIVLFFIIGFIASLVVGWVIFPKLLYSQKDQPFDFSHVIHLEEVDDDCNSCHFFREDGTFAGSPKNEQCIECHQEVQGEDPDERTYVEEYVDLDREVPWLVYSRQPDNVFFSHAAHVKMGKMECEACHEPRREMTNLKVYEENRVTGYSRDIWGKSMAGFKRNAWDRMKMDDCVECHERKRPRKTSVQTGKDACFVCHK